MTKPKLRGPQPSSGRNIPAAATRPESPEQQPSVFSLRYLQPGYSLPDCNREEKAAFADTLFKLSRMTWAEINVSSRHGRGYERIPRTQIKAPTEPSFMFSGSTVRSPSIITDHDTIACFILGRDHRRQANPGTGG